MKTMAPTQHRPKGSPASTGGQFASRPHGESDVALDAPPPGAGPAPGPGVDLEEQIQAAYRDVNETLLLDGMIVGPPHPDYEQHAASYRKAVGAARALLDEAAPNLVDEMAEVVGSQFAAHRGHVESERAALTEAVAAATKARTAAEALAALDEVIDLSDVSGSVWKRPGRQAATDYARARLENLEQDRRFYPSAYEVADALPEPQRTWVRNAAWDVVRDHFAAASERVGL